MAGCAFCENVAGTRAAEIVDEGPLWIALLDAAPATPGHTLLIPRRHVEHVWELDPDFAAALGAALQRVALRIERRLHPDGLTVAQANRVAGWQSVPHVHIHLVPRTLGDPLVPFWSSGAADRDAAAAARLLLMAP